MTAIPTPKRGRPPTLGKTKPINIDVPDELLARIDHAAKTAGKPRAVWLRDLAEQHLKTVPHA